MPIPAWLQMLEDSRLADVMREVAFPYVETVHVLALGLSVGTIAWFDLRLLGAAMRARPVSEVFQSVKGWMLGGFAVMFVTGALLFIADASDAYGNTYFRVKLVLLALAGLNALTFHLTIGRRTVDWNHAPVPPRAARVAGMVSIVLWLSVIAVGRIFAYDL
jgi:hypothetical protein